MPAITRNNNRQNERGNYYENGFLVHLEKDDFIKTKYDYAAIFIVGVNFITKGEPNRALSLAAMIKNCDKTDDVASIKSGDVVIDYLHVLSKLHIDASKENTDLAISFLNDAEAMTNFELTFFKESFPSLMRRSTLTKLEKLNQNAVIPVMREGKKLGRNDKVNIRFKDGRITTLKYKNVENQLKDGNCEIISDI